MPRAKLVIALLLTLAAVIVIFQNRETVEVQLLFMNLSMPLAVLLALAVLIGVAVGLLVALRLRARGSNRSRPAKSTGGDA